MIVEVSVVIERGRKIKLVVVVVEKEIATLLMVVAFSKIAVVEGVMAVLWRCYGDGIVGENGDGNGGGIL